MPPPRREPARRQPRPHPPSPLVRPRHHLGDPHRRARRCDGLTFRKGVL